MNICPTCNRPLVVKTVRKLIKHYGGVGRAAEALEVTRETIRLWGKKGIPLSKAAAVEAKSDGIVTVSQILKDVPT